MSTEITAAIIAAAVSLIIGLVSYFGTLITILSERKRQERELERKMTEKMIDLRIKTYPEAFEITSLLSGDNVFGKVITPDYLKNVYDQITVWRRSKAGLVLSKKSLKAYYRLKEFLLVKPQSGETYTDEELRIPWEAKNEFRRRLIEDVNFLYSEDA